MRIAKGRTAAPSARAAYVTPSHQFPLGVQMSMPRRLELLDWARQAGAFVLEDDYDSEFRYDGAPLMSLAGIDRLQRVIYLGTFAKTLFPGLRIGYCALPERLIADVTAARAALDRFPGTLMEGAVADMLNSGAFAANLKRVRKLYREARDVLAQTLEAASDGALSVPVPSQGLHLVARFDPSVDLSVAAQAKQAAGAEGWLLADTYSRARPLPGFVLGFSGHPVPQLKSSAERLARESREALRARARAARRALRTFTMRIVRQSLHCGVDAQRSHHAASPYHLPCVPDLHRACRDGASHYGWARAGHRRPQAGPAHSGG